MAGNCILRIGSCKMSMSKADIKKLKNILDILEIPYVLDSISFHNTAYAVNRMKTVHKTRVWKVEKDGSVSLVNRFGHSGRFEYRYLNMPSPLEFQFVDLDGLSNDEMEYLSFLLFKANAFSYSRTNTGV